MTQKRIRLATLRSALLALGLAALVPGSILGTAPRLEAQAGDILIVNSDPSVQRYAAAQASFKETIGRPVREFDLSVSANDEAALRRVIETTAPSLVYCIGSQAYVVTTRVAGTRTIVVSSALNMRRFPPRPRTFGVANELEPAAQMTTIRYVFPRVRRIGVIYSTDFNGNWMRQAETDDADVGFTLVGRPIRRAADLAGALAELLPKVDALWLIPDPVVLASAQAVDLIFAESDKRSKPIFSYDAAFAERGAVLAIASDVATIGRQAARLADDIAAGRVPRDRFQAPAGSELTMNLRFVRKYGMEFSTEAIASMNRIIQSP